MTKFLFLIFVLFLFSCSGSEESTTNRTASNISALLSGKQNEGFEQALTPRQFIFPQDHGPHPTFKTEWWYVTGNLQSVQGRRFGYQLTFFRNSTDPGAPHSRSKWTTNQLYMAHFAISDIDDKKHHAFERFSRDSLKLAGAQDEPFKVWLLDWSLQTTDEKLFPLTLHAKENDISIQLKLNTTKPLVLQGEMGLSKKSSTIGNASYYYSYTRLETAGEIILNGETFKVAGDSWLDREWSTSALEKSQQGWDWFALQLSNGDDIMFYQLRKKNGEIDNASAGSYISKAGEVAKLTHDQVKITPLSFWKSSSGVNYPNTWQLIIPHKNISLYIKPYLDNQELNLSVRYWEGAVNITGKSGLKNNTEAISGHGYVELAGY